MPDDCLNYSRKAALDFIKKNGLQETISVFVYEALVTLIEKAMDHARQGARGEIED